jgi:hypothetical protein
MTSKFGTRWQASRWTRCSHRCRPPQAIRWCATQATDHVAGQLYSGRVAGFFISKAFSEYDEALLSAPPRATFETTHGPWR